MNNVGNSSRLRKNFFILYFSWKLSVFLDTPRPSSAFAVTDTPILLCEERCAAQELRRIPPTFLRQPKRVTLRREKGRNHGLCLRGSILVKTNYIRTRRKFQVKTMQSAPVNRYFQGDLSAFDWFS
jgi:hypothetical protein